MLLLIRWVWTNTFLIAVNKVRTALSLSPLETDLTAIVSNWEGRIPEESNQL